MSIRRYIPAMGPIRSMGRFSRFRKMAPVTMPPPGMPGAAMDMMVEMEMTRVLIAEMGFGGHQHRGIRNAVGKLC